MEDAARVDGASELRLSRVWGSSRKTSSVSSSVSSKKNAMPASSRSRQTKVKSLSPYWSLISSFG